VSNQAAFEEEIAQFYNDVNLLMDRENVTLNQIGDEIPKLGGANFIAYHSGRNTITRRFLTKFYKAWRIKLAELRDPAYTQHDSGGGPVNESDSAFGNREAKGSGEGRQTIWESNKLLAETCKGLMETNKLLVELLSKQGIPPEPSTEAREAGGQKKAPVIDQGAS
jgi:hypothetical protein